MQTTTEPEYHIGRKGLRAGAILWARRMVEEGFVALDTETTGPGFRMVRGRKQPFPDQPVSIAIVSSSGDVLLHVRTKPTVPISEGAFAVHGISMEMLEEEGADWFWMAAEDGWRCPHALVLDELTGVENCVVYNDQFDKKILENACAVYDQPSCYTPIESHCAMIQYGVFVGELNEWGSLKWHKLGAAYEAMALGTFAAHDAAEDASATVKLVHAMARAEI